MWSSLAIATGFVLVAFLVAALTAAWMRRRHGGEHLGETAAIVGLGLVGALMFVYAPTPKHTAIVGAYAVYAGLVLYMIFDLSRPFSGLVTVGPDAFENARGSFRSGL